MTADVALELAVVAKGHLTVRAPESLGSLLLIARTGRRIVMVVGGGGGGGSGHDGRRVVVLDQWLESGHLVKFANFVGAHSQGGQSARMQSFRRGFQRSQKSFHRRSFRLEMLWQLVVMVQVMRMEGVGAGHPSGSKKRRRLVVVVAQGHHVGRVGLLDGRIRIGGGCRWSSAQAAAGWRSFRLVTRGSAGWRWGRMSSGWRRFRRADDQEPVVLFFLHGQDDCSGRRRFFAAVAGGAGGCAAIWIPRPEEFLTLSVARNQSHSDFNSIKKLVECVHFEEERRWRWERCWLDGEWTANVGPSGAPVPLYIGAREEREGWGLSRRGELDKMGGGQSQWLAVGKVGEEAVTTRPPPLAHLLLLGPVRIWRRWRGSNHITAHPISSLHTHEIYSKRKGEWGPIIQPPSGLFLGAPHTRPMFQPIIRRCGAASIGPLPSATAAAASAEGYVMFHEDEMEMI